MDLGLSGKRALITGASKGIGLAVAETLAAEGCHVVLAARTEDALSRAAEAIRARHQVQARIVPCDLSHTAETERLANAAGDVDILVNNAGAIPLGGLLDVDDETWRAAWDLKVFGFISLTRAVYARMKAQGGGVIVNVIGVAGERLPAGYLAGAAGNASLMAFTGALGGASHRDNIRVVGINPGPTLTDRLEGRGRAQAEQQFGDAGRWRELFAGMPFGRPAEAAEIAAAVAFLASPRSAYTTGTVLRIDGGAG